VTTDANGTASLDWSNSDIETVGAQALKLDGQALQNTADTDTTFSQTRSYVQGDPKASELNYRQLPNESGSYFPGDVFIASPDTYEIPNQNATLRGRSVSGKDLARIDDVKNISDAIDDLQDLAPPTGIRNFSNNTNLSQLRAQAYGMCKQVYKVKQRGLPTSCTDYAINGDTGENITDLTDANQSDFRTAIADATGALESLPGDEDSARCLALSCGPRQQPDPGPTLPGGGDDDAAGQPPADGIDLCEWAHNAEEWDTCDDDDSSDDGSDDDSGDGSDDSSDDDGLIGQPVCERFPGLGICQPDSGDGDDSDRGGTEDPNYGENGTTWSGWFPIPATVSKEDVSVNVLYSNGTRAPVLHAADGGHWWIDDRIGRSQRVMINDYPVGNSSASFQVLAIPNPDNRTGKNSTPPRIIKRVEQTTSPNYNDELPPIQAVKVDTLRPGPGQDVRVKVIPEDGTSLNVTGISAEAPNRSQLPATASADNTGSFITASEAGPHRLTIDLNRSNETFVANIGLPVGQTELSQPPSIRAHSGPLGVFPVVGDGYASGDIAVSGGQSIQATGIIAQDGEVPEETHVYLDSLSAPASATTEVRLLRGRDARTQVSQEVVTTIHHASRFPEETYVYRNGEEPITTEGTAHGRVTLSNPNGTAVTETITDDDGAVRISTVTDPGLFEQVQWQWRTTLGDLPVVGTIVPPTGVIAG
jgi:hypothetical protein